MTVVTSFESPDKEGCGPQRKARASLGHGNRDGWDRRMDGFDDLAWDLNNSGGKNHNFSRSRASFHGQSGAQIYKGRSSRYDKYIDMNIFDLLNFLVPVFKRYNFRND